MLRNICHLPFTSYRNAIALSFQTWYVSKSTRVDDAYTLIKPQHTSKINNVEVQYYAITDVLRLLLADANYLQGWQSTYDENSNVIEHPANGDGFKLLQADLSARYPSHKLVFVNIFLDEYEQHRMTKKQIYSIEMTIANAPLKVRKLNYCQKSLTFFQTRHNSLSHENIYCVHYILTCH